MKIIDITMWMGEWVYPGDKPLQISEPYSALGEEKEFCYNFSTNSVDGTHIQAPHYMLKDGKRVNDFPVEYFHREAVVIDFYDLKDEFIPSDDLRKQLENEELTNKAVIIRTGVMDRLIKGEDIKDKLMHTQDARWLVDKGIKMIVADVTCLDAPLENDGNAPSTRIFCNNDVVLVKQVCNLQSISKHYVTVEAYPLKIHGISGTPVRAVVLEE
jgi:kynurenine formamidase